MQKLNLYAMIMMSLTVINLTVKLTINPAMTWTFVFAPIWLTLMLLAIALTFVALFIGLAAMISKDAQ